MLTPLRYHRMLRGWKAAEVAAKLGISASYYSRIESGQVEASVEVRRRIAELFRLQQRTLFGSRS